MKEIMKTSGHRKTFYEELKGSTDEIINQIKRLVRNGNARKLMIQNKKGKVLFQTQLTAGLAGSTLLTFMAPIISAIGMFVLITQDMKVVIEKYQKDEIGEDEFEVDAEVIVEVHEEDDKAETNATSDDKTDKTVGREGQNSEL